MHTLPDDELRGLLSESKRIAVVGLSPIANRPSHGVSRYLVHHGYRLIGVRPATPPEILGQPCVESMAEVTGPVDIIDVFRVSEAIPQLVDEIEAWLKTRAPGERPKALWLQEGITNDEAEDKAARLGLKVISNLCILKEHARLL